MANRTDMQVGQRVRVADPALAQIERIMRAAGENPPPNNTGYIESIYEDETAIIIFDDSGSAAPYPLADCEAI